MQGVQTHPELSLRSLAIQAFAIFGDQRPLYVHQTSTREANTTKAESRLIADARGGDEDAFRRIIERFQPTLTVQMSRFSRDRTVVEDLVHDVFVEALLSLANYKGRSPFEHWLRKIAVRVGYRYWKQQAREKRRLEVVREEAVINTNDPTSHSAAVDAREQLDVMLARLSPRDRLVLTLLYWDGCSVAETAERVGWTQSMVKVQAHRARNRLKKLLEASDDE